MGCPTEVEIGDNLVFTVTTHDPDTGVLTDADAVPAYRVYEDETGTAILTGNMAKLDDANTTGFYSESIACTSGNGFESGKSYNIYIAATVDSDQGGISYGFKAYDQRKANTTLIEGTDATDQINAACDTALTDYDAVVPADLPTNFGDLSITATSGRVDIGSWLGTAVTTSSTTAKPEVDVNSISDDATAADNLEEGATAIVTGAAATGTLSTTEMTTNLSEATNDHYIGRTVVWTSGVLLGQASDITDYAGTGGKLTYTAVTDAPSDGDTFILV